MKGQEEDTQSSDFEAIPTHAREVSLNELLALLIRDRRVVLKEAVVPYALRVCCVEWLRRGGCRRGRGCGGPRP
jgi:hypothetical protein